ncbi:MAG: hypothetical protein HC919_06545 [Oscillatoriales cyanobacterium SM2_2_1]|nr:hypothetical protein [Oscillatoriales cyanobacterium SM2_2_1]
MTAALVRQIRQEARYRERATVDKILLDLRHLAAIDREAIAKKRFYGLIRNLLTLIWMPLAFVSCATGFTATRLGIFSGLVGVVFFGWFLFFSWKRSRYNVLDLPDYRYQMAQRLIEMTRRDSDEYGLCHIQISFAPPKHPTRTESHPYRLGWKVEFYDDPWLLLQGQFLDGTHYSLTLREKCQIRKGRNLNGNQRVKPRNKGLELTLNLRCDRRYYGNFSQASQQLGKSIKLPAMTQVKDLQTKGRRVKIRAVVPSWQALKLQGSTPVKLSPEDDATIRALYRTITATFLSGYQFLNYARLQKKPLLG